MMAYIPVFNEDDRRARNLDVMQAHYLFQRLAKGDNIPDDVLLELIDQGLVKEADEDLPPDEVLEAALPKVEEEEYEPDVLADAINDAPFPDPMLDEAYEGLAGDLIDAIVPYTDASKEGLLTVLLTEVGVLAGPRPSIYYGGVQHANLFTVLVGDTGRGRKGTALAMMQQAIAGVEPVLLDISHGGVGSGEGLVMLMKGAIDADPAGLGRIFLREEEFARLLKAAGREGSTVSELLRQAYDGRALQRVTAASNVRVTDYHTGFHGHCTREDLTRFLDNVEVANGYANRFLYIPVQKRDAEVLQEAWTLPSELKTKLADALVFASTMKTNTFIGANMPVEEEAIALLDDEASRREAVLGVASMLARRLHVHAARASIVYAVLDQSPRVTAAHVRRALAFTEYGWRGLIWAFGEATGDPDADLLLRHLRAAGRAGLSTRARARLFSNVPSRIQKATDPLIRLGLAELTSGPSGRTGGRPTKILRLKG